jgi:hypothetical protein
VVVDVTHDVTYLDSFLAIASPDIRIVLE